MLSPTSGSIPISSREELARIGNHPDYPTNFFAAYHLTKDIDLGSAAWTPIRNFQGTLDGQGHVIKNLHMAISADNSMINAGLISEIPANGRAVIENLGIEVGTQGIAFQSTYDNVYTVLGSYAGGIIGRINSGANAVIWNCFVTGGSITTTNLGTSFMGGPASSGSLVGVIHPNAYIEIDHSFTTVSTSAMSISASYAGGLIGRNENNNAEIWISNSYAAGNVEASGGTRRAGGLISTSSGTPAVVGRSHAYILSTQVVTPATTGSGGDRPEIGTVITPEQLRNGGIPGNCPVHTNAWAYYIAGENSNLSVLRDFYHVDDIIMDTNLISLNVGESYNINATIIPEKANKLYSLRWDSSINNVVNLNQNNGFVSAVNSLDPYLFPKGEAVTKITASAGGRSESRDVQVTQIATGITLLNPKNPSDNTASIMVGDPIELKTTVHPVNAFYDGVNWDYDDSILRIDGEKIDGDSVITTFTAIAASDSPIRITAGTTNQRATQHYDHFDLNIVPLDVPIQTATLKESTRLDIGETELLQLAFIPENATIKSIEWIESDTDIVKVIENLGKAARIEAASPGVATITSVIIPLSGQPVILHCTVTVTDMKNRIIEPEIITKQTDLPNGVKGNVFLGVNGIPFFFEATASGIWSIDSGNLPNGLFLSAHGTITGTPVEEGIFNFVVKIENALGSENKQFSIIIKSLPVILSPDLLPRGIVNREYNYMLNASGTEPIRWRVIAGNFPPGLELDEETGNIHGTPTKQDNYHFIVEAINDAGSQQKYISLIINQLFHIHAIIILDKDTYEPMTNATIIIDAIEYTSDNYGTFVIEGISGIKMVRTSAENYMNNIQRYNITNNTQRVILLEKNSGDCPYISMATEAKSGNDLRTQPIHFTEGNGEMLELIVLGEWINSAAKYELYQNSYRENGKDIQGVSLTVLPGSFGEISDAALFSFAPGLLLHPERPVMLKMVSSDGMESQPIRLNITIIRQNPVTSQFNNSYDASDTTEMDLFGTNSANTSGQDFAKLFPFDFSIGGVGGEGGNTGITGKVSVEIKTEQTENGIKIKGMIGRKWKEDDDFNEFMKAMTTVGKYPEFRDRIMDEYKDMMKRPTWKGSQVFEYEVLGFLEVELDKNGNVVHAKGGIIAGLEYGRVWGQTFMLGPVPVYYELKITVGAEFTGELGFYRPDEDSGLRFGLGAEIKITIPKITLGAGVGIRGLATVGVEGEAALEITTGGKWNTSRTHIDPVWKGYIQASGSVKIKLLFVIDFKWTFAQIPPPGYKLWDIDDKIDDRARAMALFGEIPDGIYPELSLTSRDYTQRTTAWNGGGKQISMFSAASIGNDSIHSLQDWVMPDTIPQITRVGNDFVMLFQSDDPAKTLGNNTVLMYSVNKNGNSSWSVPQPVWDNGTADFFYDFIVENDELYVVWQKLDAQVNQSDAIDLLREISENSEIAFAKFNKTTGTFENQVFVTDNDVLNMYPTIAVNGIETSILWVSNDACDPMGVEGAYSIMKSEFVNGNFNAPVKLYETDMFVSELVAGYVNNNLEIAFAAGDNVDETAGYILTFGRAMRFTGEDSAIAIKYQNGLFYWHSLGSVYNFDPTTRISTRVAIPDEYAVASSYRLIKANNKDAIVWINNNGDNYSINAAIHLGNGNWSLPITLLTIDDALIWFADAVSSDNGTWNIVMNTINPETEMSSLVFATVTPKTETELIYAYANKKDAVNGLVPVYISINNLGENTVQSLNVNIASAQKSYYSSKYSVMVEPGHTEDFIVYIDISGLNEVTEMNVSVFADGEYDMNNNNAAIQLGEVDVAISLTQYHVDDTVLVVAQINNDSATPANVTVNVIEDSLNGNVIRTENLGITNQFEGRLFTHRINLNDIDFGDGNSKAIFFKVETSEPNYSEFKNYEIIIVYKPETFEIIDLPPEELTIIHATSVSIDNSAIYLNLDDKNQNEIKLSATVYPSNATNKNVRWEVENLNIAHVDSLGIISGRSAGVTRITAITYDGGYIDSVMLYVTASEVEKYQLDITAGFGGNILTNVSGLYETREQIILVAMANDDYIFSHWTSSNGGEFENVNSATTSFTMPANDVTVMAVFVEKALYISFDVDGIIITTAKVISGEKAVQPADPNKLGFIFDGWRIGGVDGEHYDFNEPVRDNIILYAAWRIVYLTNATNATFISIIETMKNSRVWILTFDVKETYSNGTEQIVRYNINLNGNNANLDGRFTFGIDHPLTGYTLEYDIKGNGSNIKDFKIIKNK